MTRLIPTALRVGASLMMAVFLAPSSLLAQDVPLPPGCSTSGMQKAANAIYNSSSTIVASNGVIDVHSWNSSGSLCDNLNAALTALNESCHPYAVGEAVLDARGFSSSTALSCSSNPFANTGITNITGTHATVLLPAATITLSVPWVLPARTRLIGEGPQATVLSAGSGFTGSDMIDIGAGSSNSGTFYCAGGGGMFFNCNGVQIEHLGLMGPGLSATQTVNGVVNLYGEELSYLNDVEIDNMSGTALTLGVGYNSSSTSDGSATNSGPYTNIASKDSATCVRITGGTTSGGFADTRGIYGLSCSLTSSSTTATAVFLDASNTTLENVSINQYHDGITVGQNGPARADTIKNAYGTGVTNLIHVSSGTSTPSGSAASQFCPSFNTSSGTYYNACDLSVLVAASANSSNVILDDLTGNHAAASTNPVVGMYALGEQQATGGYGFASTSSALPTWYSGLTVPPSGATGCATGSLYSCGGTTSAACSTQGSPPKTSWLYACYSGTWYRVK